MTKVFDYTHFKYTPDPENPRLISENEISRGPLHWPNGLSRSFAERLLSKFPKWQCVRTWNYSSQFRIVSGTEYLGTVRCYDGKIEIRNHRIDKERTRKGGMVTKDPDKAFKLVCKYFSTKSKKERIETALKETRTWVQSEQYSANSNFRMQFTNLAYAAKDYIMQDLEPYRVAAKAGGFDITKSLQLEDLFERSGVSTAMQNLLDKNLGSIITREGDGYLLSDPQGNEVISIDDTLLPGPVREALGKLKLMEPRTMLSGVGVRIDANTFFVVVK